MGKTYIKAAGGNIPDTTIAPKAVSKSVTAWKEELAMLPICWEKEISDRESRASSPGFKSFSRSFSSISHSSAASSQARKVVFNAFLLSAGSKLVNFPKSTSKSERTGFKNLPNSSEANFIALSFGIKHTELTCLSEKPMSLNFFLASAKISGRSPSSSILSSACCTASSGL